MDTNTLKKLNRFLTSMEGGEQVTEKDFERFFELFTKSLKDLQDYVDEVVSGVRSEMSELDIDRIKRIEGMMNQHEKALKDIRNVVKTSIEKSEFKHATNVKEMMSRLENMIADTQESIPEMPDISPVEDKIEMLKREHATDIRDLKEEIYEMKKKLVDKPVSVGNYFGVGGFRKLSGSKFSFTGDGSTTQFSLPRAVAGKDLFIWAHYQGQWLQNGVHYSVTGKTFDTAGGTSTFTAENGTVIEGFIINF